MRAVFAVGTLLITGCASLPSVIQSQQNPRAAFRSFKEKYLCRSIRRVQVFLHYAGWPTRCRYSDARHEISAQIVIDAPDLLAQLEKALKACEYANYYQPNFDRQPASQAKQMGTEKQHQPCLSLCIQYRDGYTIRLDYDYLFFVVEPRFSPFEAGAFVSKPLIAWLFGALLSHASSERATSAERWLVAAVLFWISQTAVLHPVPQGEQIF